MEDNEDEPEDVRKATPVANEIESGSKDEKAGNAKGTRSEKKDAKKSSRCEKNAKKPTLAKSEADCCRSKITKSSKTPKMMSVMVYSPPCTFPRLEIIPRHCLSKQEYIDILAAPSRKCPPECLGKTVVRKIRPISARINELAQPARRLIVGTLKERGETLPPEMISNLVNSIEGSACMTPEQAEKYFRDKEREKERKVGKSHGRQKCKGKSKRDQCSSQLDKEAVMCQYLMAERFVKSILQWKCPIPVEEFQDIASVILRRLSFVLEYTPIDGQDLKSQQMRFLADIIACWISGVLFEVAEEHKKEIEEEFIAHQEEEEDEDEEDEEDEEDDEEVEANKKPVEETDDDEEEEEKEEDLIRQENENETPDAGTQNEKDGGIEDEAPENLVVVKSEPSDEDINSPEELAEREKAKKEAEEREQERLAAERKKIQEQEEEQARKEAEEKAKMEEEEEAKRKDEAEAKRLREEEEEEEERKKKQQEEEEENRLRIEAEEKEKKEQEEKEKEKEEEEENRKKKELEEEEEEEKRKKKEQEEEEEKRMKKEQEEEEEKKMKKEQEEEDEKRLKKEQEEAEAEAEEKRVREEQAEEEEKRKRQEQKVAEDQKKKKEEEEAELKRMGPKKAIEGIGDGELFGTDLPFVTFGKILDTVYNMLEEEPEGDETDIIHNRIQRSLYEKFARLIELEAPDSLTENLKDVVDVFAGKAATWVKRLLKDSELKFMNDNPAEVESKEIRDWGKWIDQVTDRAGDWADWIHRVVNEAEEKSATIVQRGDWKNWTSDMETNALLWRRYYLETIHQAHHNKMMIVDRPVVKTRLSAVEEEINSTDLAA